MVNHPLKKLWRRRDSINALIASRAILKWKFLPGTPGRTIHGAPLCTAARDPREISDDSKYLSFAKQAASPKETRGNLNDLGLIS